MRRLIAADLPTKKPIILSKLIGNLNIRDFLPIANVILSISSGVEMLLSSLTKNVLLPAFGWLAAVVIASAKFPTNKRLRLFFIEPKGSNIPDLTNLRRE